MKMPVRVTLSIDPAVTDRKKSDFTGFIINMTDINTKWWIYEAEAFKGKPNEVVDRAVQYILLYRPAAISIETVAAQILYRDLLLPRMRDEGIHTAITEYMPPNQYSKRAKIEKLQPRFKKGLIAIRQGLLELVRQLDEFPENDHDDLLDALCQQDAIARAPQPFEILGSMLDEDDFDYEPQEQKRVYANVGYCSVRR